MPTCGNEPQDPPRTRSLARRAGKGPANGPEWRGQGFSPRWREMAAFVL